MENNHRTRWTQEENALLQELWDPTAVEVVAEVFGRTVDAVRQRHYELSWDTAPKAPAAKPVMEGLHQRNPNRRPSVQLELRVGKVCSVHNIATSLTGDCDLCS